MDEPMDGHESIHGQPIKRIQILGPRIILGLIKLVLETIQQISCLLRKRELTRRFVVLEMVDHGPYVRPPRGARADETLEQHFDSG
ncbi:hypothetical protein QP968_07690 [Corynebacterium sp. MSK041]|uniref:hypothetical protein n=1 Tax=Corynebacterium sp. MSK041 TaxID=3050194 RepID=UPI00254A6830|nr:hypothetical protein [Corynebacterium sp. MSK041]MDK8795589.1 hypothetical protein [Corynebacterium sp. MSK041]